MAIHVNIGEAKTRLSELVAAAVRGEDIVLDKAGTPQVRLVPMAPTADDRKRIAARRLQLIGLWREAFAGYDTGIRALKAERADPDERFRRKFGPAD